MHPYPTRPSAPYIRLRRLYPAPTHLPLEPASSRHGTSHHARAPDPAGPSSGRPAVLRQMTSIISHFADVSSKPPRGPAPTFPRHRREHCVTRLGRGNVTVRGMAFSSPQNPPTPPGGGSIARPGTVAEASPSAGWSSSGLLGPPYHLPANLPTAPQSRVAMGTRTEGVSSGRAGPPCKGGGTRALVTASLHSPQIRGRAVDAISRQRYRSYNCPRADLSGGMNVAGYCVAGSTSRTAELGKLTGTASALMAVEPSGLHDTCLL